jgi:hypothetical protein
MCSFHHYIFVRCRKVQRRIKGSQKWEPKAELRMLSISMVCLSNSEGQHIATMPLAPTSSSFLKTKAVRVDDLVQGDETLIVPGGRDNCIVTLSKYVGGGGTKQMWGTWFRIRNPRTRFSCRYNQNSSLRSIYYLPVITLV